MGRLIENMELYGLLEKSVPVTVHAIYEPDEHEVFGDCYLAAMDLFRPGLTFKVFFSLDEKGSVQVQHAERWYFG